MKLPEHKCGLYITHNEHKDLYQSAEEFINDCYELNDFTSAEDRQKCIDTGELWCVHWYPHTPVGFHRVCGSSLELVLDAAAGSQEHGE